MTHFSACLLLHIHIITHSYYTFILCVVYAHIYNLQFKYYLAVSKCYKELLFVLYPTV